MTDKKPDNNKINDFLRSPRNDGQRFTVVQDGRSGKLATTTSTGETFSGRDGLNDAIFRIVKGTEPRHRRDNDEGGGTA